MFVALLACLFPAYCLSISFTKTGQSGSMSADHLPPFQMDIVKGATSTKTDVIEHVIAAEECSPDSHNIQRRVTGMTAIVYIMNLNHTVDQSENFMLLPVAACRVAFEAPKGYYMNIAVNVTPHLTCYDVNMFSSDDVACDPNNEKSLQRCWYGDTSEIFSTSNSGCVALEFRAQSRIGTPWAVLHFAAVPFSPRHVLNTVYTSPASGYIASYHSPQLKPHALGIDAFHDLTLSSGQVLMVSFPVQSVGRSRPPEYRGLWLPAYQSIIVTLKIETSTVTLYEIPKKRSYSLPYTWEGRIVPPRVFNSSIRVHFRTPAADDISLGFKMLFSFHPNHETPALLADGLFNCSTPHYASFKQHVHCNLEPECHGGQDESQCPFHHPACNGSVGHGTKCFTLVAWHERLTWTEAERVCHTRGGSLASLKTFGQWQAVSHFFSYGIRRSLFYIGARKLKETEIHNDYKKLWMWSDHTVAFSVTNRDGNGTCLFCGYHKSARCGTLDCGAIRLTTNFICEFNNTMPRQIVPPKPQRPTQPFPKKQTACSLGHLAHPFMSCDADCQRGLQLSVTSCSVPGKGTLPKFTCEDGKHRIHYSLVCNYRNDCPDASDERFCVHDVSLCPYVTCYNSQCLGNGQLCDDMQHCVDNTDERLCPRDERLWFFFNFIYRRIHYSDLYVVPGMMLELDGRGEIKVASIEAPSQCPETHFWCDGDHSYCLPVYMRCNGMNDCPDHEDEAECADYSCPGLYRCLASSVCLHPHYMCDSIFHCPRQDDEWMCSQNDTCPSGCQCQALAFICSGHFVVDWYPDLRYLDASQSGMALQDLNASQYLVRLVLARNNLTVLPEVSLPNLLFLDVSDNLIQTINTVVFLGLSNLRVVRISNNPLLSIKGSKRGLRHERLNKLDMAYSKFVDFDSKVLSDFPELTELNLSYSSLRTIGENGLKYLPSLRTLDLHGSPLENFPLDIFNQLGQLEFIRSDNYKLCCRQVLPRYVKDGQCVAPVSEVSSCEDLLRTDVFRTALWVCAALSLSGNACSLLFRLVVQRKTSMSAFGLFVTNLCVADFIMGLYLVMIGTADQLLRGEYLRYDRWWKRHVACKTAGFLSLLSSEVSAFFICLITLDRFIRLRFPFSVVHFGRLSGSIACCLVWVLGVCLAGLPLLPMMRHWTFYGQTGICIPLPVTRQYFAGSHYAFEVMIVLNFVLFVLVALGQVSIYWSLKTDKVLTSKNRRSQDLTIARRLFSVAVSDFLCWFPVCLLGMLANRGTPIPGYVSVSLAIFVLPVNSALNPFLYTFNMLMEKRRKAAEASILRLLEARYRVKIDAINFPVT